MATSYTKISKGGVNWSGVGGSGTTNYESITGDVSNVWQDTGPNIPTNWTDLAGSSTDWEAMPDDFVMPDQFAFMPDNTPFYWGTDFDFGVEYESTSQELQVQLVSGEKAFGITKENVVSLAALTETPSTEGEGNLAYVSGKLMVKEEE